MSAAFEIGTVSVVIEFRVLVLVLVVTAVPTVATLLSAPAEATLTPPAGATAWRADNRHLPDPVRTDPAALHHFLAAAGQTGQQDLVTRYPGVIGALDGAAPQLRYAANQLLMHTAGPPYRDEAGSFLLFDPRGRGRIAEVFGDLATADRIAILVPGVGNQLNNFWTGVGDRGYRAPAVQAGNLYQSAVQEGTVTHFAVIAWLGYDTPDGVGISAAREDVARAGAAALDRFVAGLVAVRPHATIALLGHSYGSTVIGVAASRLPGAVTDIAVFGSPGMSADNVAGLHTTARVWVGQSTGDWIKWVPGIQVFGLGHGTKPTDPRFGARIFPTVGVPDHDHYLSPGTDSLGSLTSIATSGTDTDPRS
ncbi:alpha/beta hydrolase [Amycolatopsis sp. GM8]|uniref:alpha/beta hydrolase n=1 Tax=Amycolatopsis sp. GM8 TaxID=2896530 RepID=UPI001F468A7E|nr:alpha/beta hydrolase [Amycolatopsis sp. GM8]